MLHSVVGLAAVMTSIASVMADLDHATTLHLVTAYLGVVIGQLFDIPIVQHPQAPTLRRDHVHWFYCRILEACGTHVVQAVRYPC